MPACRTHFEQIPLEVVKKIAEVGVSKDRKRRTDNVFVDRAPGKNKPQAVRGRSLGRKRR